MASTKVKIDQMADALIEIMGDLKETCNDTMKKTVKKAGKSIASEIRATAPRRTEKYAESWRSSIIYEGANSIQVIVHSPNRYQIAHLLEHGHAKRNGGRVQAIPHIEPAENKVMGSIDRELKRGIENE